LRKVSEEQIVNLGAEIQQLRNANEDLQGKTVDRTTARALAATLTSRIKSRVARMFNPN
jgi:hypothetical protein